MGEFLIHEYFSAIVSANQAQTDIAVRTNHSTLSCLNFHQFLPCLYTVLTTTQLFRLQWLPIRLCRPAEFLLHRDIDGPDHRNQHRLNQQRDRCKQSRYNTRYLLHIHSVRNYERST